MPIQHDDLKRRRFLPDMYDDGYFPDFLVDKCKAVLVRLCEAIEAQRPADLAGLYALTHAATEELNDLAEEFEAHDSELETGARESLAAEFRLIAEAYGYDADSEDLIAPRHW